ncbi:nose resistant to fluoxetine protein 6-like [Pecten maximus]|uniref:nose resistant to fluoxetine protein 6-like n=1 Tax=Pecten maximus TaxID=6579 RepID=UPI001457F121|nr:nose resistant to fluoxetine protein 6-like [Pecten maximus]
MKTNGADPGYMYKINGDANQTENTTTPYSGICSRLILSFSVWTNVKKLLNTDDKPDTIGAINGIRFFSMSWVILAQTFSSALDSNVFTNQWSGKTQMFERHSFMAVSNGFLSVDSLFAMTGILVSYFFMKEMKREKGCINWFKFYFHRFWRLTPPYMLVMMVDIALFRYLGDGPMWSPDGIETNFCKDTWWTNPLYINNFVKSENRCFSWSWYLTNDMQFYVLSPILLVPLYFSKKIGGFIAAIFLVGVTGASAYISYANDLPLSRYSSDLAQNTEDYFEMYYIKPYCRMGPYIVGVIFGYALYRSGGKYKINLVFSRFIWILMSALACVMVYAIYPEMSGSSASAGVTSLYNAVHKTLWGVCVCWVVFACVTRNGGFVNSFLSWGVFVPLRRLTYCAYLVHPLVIASYYQSHRQGFYMTDFNIIYLFLGHLTLTYMVACVIYLAFQAPLIGLERAIMRRDKEEEMEEK